MVYRSSGLNAGRAGRFLPFGMLSAPERATISSATPGYIFKAFFFDHQWRNHRKEPGKFGPGIAEFLLEIEEFLEDKYPDVVNYDYIKTYKDILPIAKAINVELEKAIKGLSPFDWQDLIKEP